MISALPGRVELWLAIAEPRHVLGAGRLTSAEWAQVLACGIDGVSVRAGRPGSQEMAAFVLDAGLRLAVERWGTGPGSRTDDRDAWEAAGRRYGATLAEDVLTHGAEAGRVNWEREVARFGSRANPHMDTWLDSAASEYHSLEAGELEDLGYVDPRLFYPDDDADGDGQADNEIPTWWPDRVRRKWAMAYPSDYDDIVRKLSRARQVWGLMPLGCYLSPPRLDKRGRLVGRPDVIQHVAIARPQNIEAVCIYIGMDQDNDPDSPSNPWTTLIRGNRLARSVVTTLAQIRMIERAWGAA